MKYILILFFFMMTVSRSFAQFYEVIPGEKNRRYDKGGFSFIVFNKKKTIDTLEGSFIKRSGHRVNFIRVKRNEIFPETVDSLYLFTKKKGLTSDTLKAVSLEGKFLFNTVTGPIRSYNMVPYTDKQFSIFFQKENGAVEYNTNHFRKKILKEWVSDDEGALSEWKTYRKRKVTRTIGPIATVVLGLTATTILARKNKDDAAGLAFVGTNLCWPLWYFIRPIHPSKIIEKYNANKRKDEKFFSE